MHHSLIVLRVQGPGLPPDHPSMSPDARPFGLKNADVLAISPSGEVAVALNARASGALTRVGTLARHADGDPLR